MLSKNRAGMILGAFLGIWHLLWAILVAVGLAQPLLDFVFRLHFIKNPYLVVPFDILTAVELVALTAVMGYVVGWFLAFLWEMMAGKQK